MGLDGPYRVYSLASHKGLRWMELNLESYSQTSREITLHALAMKNAGMRQRPVGEVASWYDHEKNLMVVIIKP